MSPKSKVRSPKPREVTGAEDRVSIVECEQRNTEHGTRNTLQRSNAFTLLELLLVISVIALLAALLLPTLARSKASAQRIKCTSNLHQLGLAAHLYWDDNNGHCFRYGG